LAREIDLAKEALLLHTIRINHRKREAENVRHGDLLPADTVGLVSKHVGVEYSEQKKGKALHVYLSFSASYRVCACICSRTGVMLLDVAYCAD
jgi:hypothetical protein